MTIQSTRGSPSPIAQQQAIENALSMALYHVRNGDTDDAIRHATAKAVRAMSMLKQACSEFDPISTLNDSNLGRRRTDTPLQLVGKTSTVTKLARHPRKRKKA